MNSTNGEACENCDQWGTHAIHAACFHVYSVRGNGGHLGALRTCSATRSVLTAFERASKHAHAVHVIDIVDNAAVVDIPMLSAEPWFHDLCSYCLADKKASADIISWSTFLHEVVLDRCATDAYNVRTFTFEELNLAQRLAVKFNCGRVLQLLL